ncbi:MAG: cyclic pyranopterin monophosphate synthase MoaC [Rickettsiales bacterium]|nr:cyclic pyranopterin monophosphate synthase MoaC [Rickettsiales bacterium]
MKFTHLRNQKINMVDISKKKSTSRCAIAVSYVRFTKKSFKKLIDKGSPKGEIFNTARCAGILGAKKTSELIPLCHNINLSDVNIDFKIDEKMLTIKIQSEVITVSATGVEMEALTSCIIASLTIYDMCKSIDKKITIETTKLIYKSGGKSGIFKND